jgi:hypothetical protein
MATLSGPGKGLRGTWSSEVMGDGKRGKRHDVRRKVVK